jgi:hypothetical protein
MTAASDFRWTEGVIAAAVCRQVLKGRCVVMVDRCSWTGHECDVLAVTRDLRIVDVEVKVSRSDFRADAGKEKWWQRRMRWTTTDGRREQVLPGQRTGPPQVQKRQHPPRVWKHYFAVPAAVWTPDLLSALPSEDCGVLTADWRRGRVVVDVVRAARPARHAYRLTAAEALDVARLANLRMWDAYEQRDRLLAEAAAAAAGRWQGGAL